MANSGMPVPSPSMRTSTTYCSTWRHHRSFEVLRLGALTVTAFDYFRPARFNASAQLTGSSGV